MLSAELNDELTRVSPGTPMSELIRAKATLTFPRGVPERVKRRPPPAHLPQSRAFDARTENLVSGTGSNYTSFGA